MAVAGMFNVAGGWPGHFDQLRSRRSSLNWFLDPIKESITPAFQILARFTPPAPH